MPSFRGVSPDFYSGDLDLDLRGYLMSGEFATKPEIPRNEFEEVVGNRCGSRPVKNTLRDSFSLFSGIKSLYEHLTITEFVTIALISVGMTCFFCLYYYPASFDEQYHLSARLRFNIIVTAVVFPSTMLVAECQRRRETCLQRYATMKGTLCNILLAFLTWRSKNIVMSEEWEAATLQTVRECAEVVGELLLLPTLRDRHVYTKHGRNFSERVIQTRGRLQARLLSLNMDLHYYVEDLKMKGLSPMESIRLFQYINSFSREFEQAWGIKVYRTARSARVFVRIVLSSCLLFYGPYYSFIAGAIPDQPSTMRLAFSIVLTLLSTMTLLAIVSMHRASEDPFRWWYPGNAVDVKFETKDAMDKFEVIYQSYRAAKSLKANSTVRPQS